MRPSCIFSAIFLCYYESESEAITMDYHFFATVSRMKYIERWALMRSSRRENLSEHSLEVAMIAHALCLIGVFIFVFAMSIFYINISDIFLSYQIYFLKNHQFIF